MMPLLADHFRSIARRAPAALCLSAAALALQLPAAASTSSTASTANLATPAADSVLAATTAHSPHSLADCNGIKDLAFVAHLDDDLLFMNPDIAANIEAGGCVKVVYMTASDAGEGDGYMLGRERGVRAAYAYMARQPDLWRADAVKVGKRHIARFTLHGNPRIQLWHMRLKDPWLGKGWGSLTPLSQTESVPGQTADTLGPHFERYTRDELVQTVAAIIRGEGPTTVRHLDDTIDVPYTALCWRCAGHGHPDHIASARLVREAMLQAPGNYAEAGYIDYPSQERDANLADAEIASKSEIFRHYAWNDYHYCAGPAGCQEPAGPAAAWVQRSYYVSRHDVAPALFADAKGGLLLLTTGEDNDAVNLWDARVGRWQTLGGRTAGPLAAFAYPDASLGIFARDALSGLWVNRQNLDGTWTRWQAMAGVRVAQVPAVSVSGTAAVALGNDGRYYWSTLSGIGGNWNPWQPLPPLQDALGGAAIAQHAAGRYTVFAQDRQGRLHAARQDESGKHWTAWQVVPAPPAGGGLAAIGSAQGRIDIYLRQRDTGHLTRIVQAPGPTPAQPLSWSAGEDLGIKYVGRPAAALGERGQVVLAVLEQLGGALWLVEDGKPVRLQVDAASVPAIRIAQGTLYVAARNTGPRQSYQLLARRHGDWQTSIALDGLPSGGGGPFAAQIATPDLPSPAEPPTTSAPAPELTAAATGPEARPAAKDSTIAVRR